MSRELVVVTGAAGFVGAALCAHFEAGERRYRALVRALAPGHPRHGDVVALGDLATVPEARLAAVLDGAAAVVHLAGRAHVVNEATPDVARYREANAVATGRLAAAAARAGVRRFVLASTVKVHGEATLPGQAFRSDDPYAPQDAYARSKVEAERALIAACAGTSMTPVILRAPLVYGPGVRGNFLALLEAVARRAPLPLAAIGNRRDLLHVGNLVHAIAALLDGTAPESLPAGPDTMTGAWLVADGEPISTPDLIRRVARSLGVAPRLIPIPVPLLEIAARLGGRGAQVRRLVQSLEVDATPLARRIGPMPFTLEQGLAATGKGWRERHAI